MDNRFRQIISQFGRCFISNSCFFFLFCFFNQKHFSLLPLVHMLNILMENLDCTLVFVDENIMNTNQLLIKHRFIVTELNENYANYMSKKALAIDYLDSIKAHLKLQSLGEPVYDKCVSNEQEIHMCIHLYST